MIAGGDTPLTHKLRAEIEASPSRSISVERYMRLCLYDPEHGYYSRSDILGTTGDFITAPEISQVFGELIGLWCGAVWQQIGSPSMLSLVEFGPGRGTLMADILRVAQRVPGFAPALRVHLVETSPRLAAIQTLTLKSHTDVVIASDWPAPEDLAPGPVILIGNEFVDALPIDQFVFQNGAWRLRGVALTDDGGFTFVAGDGTYPGIATSATPCDGDVLETSSAGHALSRYISGLVLKQRPVAALFIDYGHTETTFGDTLQGVRDHHHVSPFTRPGETDLSSQVDFAALGRALQASGFGLGTTVVEPLTTQAEFLGRLGIVERASRLMAANPDRAGDIEAGVARLLAPNGMGTRFKVIALRSGIATALPGLA